MQICRLNSESAQCEIEKSQFFILFGVVLFSGITKSAKPIAVICAKAHSPRWHGWRVDGNL